MTLVDRIDKTPNRTTNLERWGIVSVRFYDFGAARAFALAREHLNTHNARLQRRRALADPIRPRTRAPAVRCEP
jgi:hypothetical protein